MESEKGSGSSNHNVAVAFVVVFVAIGMAVSGWFMLSVMEKIEGKDPFVVEHDYDVSGTYDDGTQIYVVTGTAYTKHSSETESYDVMTFHIRYAYGDNAKTLRSDFMFNSDRSPSSEISTFVGKSGDNELWQNVQDGYSMVYEIDSQHVIVGLSISGDGIDIKCSIV